MKNTASVATALPADDSQQLDYRWTPNEWMIEPGANSASFNPPGSGVVKTLPPLDTSVFDGALPALTEEVKAVNDTYLELTSGLAGNKWIAVLGTILFAAPMALALLVGIVWSFFEPDFIAGFFSSIGTALMFIALVVVFSVGVMPMIFSLFTIAFFSPEDEPIRFCRCDRKVYRYQAKRWRYCGVDIYRFGKPEIKVYDWTHCRAEVVRKIITTGKTIRRDCFLELAILNPNTNTVRERFRIGDRDAFSDFTKRIFLWETVRRYMEEGVDKVAPAMPNSHRGNLIDCMDEFNPFALPAKSHPGAQRFISYIYAALLWVSTPLLILVSLCRWIGIKASRKVDWRWLDVRALQIEPDDPTLTRPDNLEGINSAISVTELKRRKSAMWLWITSFLLQIMVVSWVFSGSPFKPFEIASQMFYGIVSGERFQPKYYLDCPRLPDGTWATGDQCREVKIE